AQDFPRHANHHRDRLGVGQEVVRQSRVAEHEIARFELRFVAVVIERARPLGLQQKVEQPRRVGLDVALLALEAAAVERQPGKLARPQLADTQFGIEVILVARRELTLAHPGCIDLTPRGGAAYPRQPVRRQKFHVQLSRGPALWRLPSVAPMVGWLHCPGSKSTLSETRFRLSSQTVATWKRSRGPQPTGATPSRATGSAGDSSS